MTWRLVDGHTQPGPITDCFTTSYRYRYHVIFTTLIPKLEVVAAEVQEALFDHDAVAASFYLVSRERSPENHWLWHAVFERYDCETDYHNCYDHNHGHDGSDLAAVRQLQGEIDEALASNPNPPLIDNVMVVERRVIDTDLAYVAWGADTRELLLKEV